VLSCNWIEPFELDPGIGGNAGPPLFPEQCDRDTERARFDAPVIRQGLVFCCHPGGWRALPVPRPHPLQPRVQIRTERVVPVLPIHVGPKVIQPAAPAELVAQTLDHHLHPVGVPHQFPLERGLSSNSRRNAWNCPAGGSA
jgi:hypothetical protein